MMHSDRKYIKTSMLTETDPYTQENNQHGGSFIVSNTYFEGTKKSQKLTKRAKNEEIKFLFLPGGSTIFNQDSRSVSTEFKAPSVGGWMASGPPSHHPTGSQSGTLTKRSTSRNAMLAPRIMSAPDALVKDYTKKRWIILALLSVEIETVVTTQYPLETTREALQALLSSCESSTGTAPHSVEKQEICSHRKNIS